MEKPLQDNSVSLQVEDARAVFHSAPKGKFDLVITGLLDSHTTPNLSNARLDNFVYTRESLSAVSRLLSDSGVVVMSFVAQRPYIFERIRRTIDAVFDSETLVFGVPETEFGWSAWLFVNGNQDSIKQVLEQNPDIAEHVNRFKVEKRPEEIVEPTTDNWPYLYIQNPSIPSLFRVL